MKKTIAVIGSSSHADKSLVSRLAALGHPLLLADRKWESVKRCILTQHANASVEMIDCSLECAWQADVILLYHCEEYLQLLDTIKSVITGKLIVNIVSDLKDYRVHDLLPYAKVVNTLADFTIGIESYAVKGENYHAVEQVALLFDAIGLKSNQVNN